MSTTHTPTVSVGLPVYNGESYLAEALDSILNQTFTDFELIISDNASTDQTEEICRRAAERDHRIYYYRSSTNQGAAWNFRHVFELSQGRYFKWMAADDLISPTMLADCVAALKADDASVLAWPRNVIIDENGNELTAYDSKLRSGHFDPVIRFFDLLRGHKCYEIFGLIRRSALAQTEVMGDYGHSDGVVLAHLGLIGRFHAINSATFYPRRHATQSMAAYGVYDDGSIDYHSYTAWFAPHKAGSLMLPHWKIATEFMRSIVQAPINLRQQLMCTYRVARWCGNHRHQLWGDLRRVLGGVRSSRNETTSATSSLAVATKQGAQS